MRIALAVLMVLHGLAHLVGFAGSWQIAAEGIPYKTTILHGRVDLGNAGIRVIGALWLATAVAFVWAAIVTITGVPWWPQFALVVAIVSLLLSVVEFPEAKLGIAINVAIIASLSVGRWMGRL